MSPLRTSSARLLAPKASPRRVASLLLFVWLLLIFAGASGAYAQSPGSRGVKKTAAERGEGRVALVLGNAAYTTIPALQNSVNDALDMADALERIGFEVIERQDETRAGMYAAIRTLAEKARGAEVALLFYAGHGVEVGGENYLIPLDVDHFENDDFQVANEAVPLGQALGALKTATVQVVVLDACRSNPFPNGVAASEGGGGWGIPSGDALGGTLVAYGTAPGAVASDNVEGRNGLFTDALLAEIETPGLEAAEMMRRVTRRVREASADAQSPWLSASYVLPFYFSSPNQETRPADYLADASRPEIETWARTGRAAYVRKDYEAARPDLQKAARAGHTDSQYYLGTMYLAGYAVDEDPTQAADWFELASLRGHPKAQYFLGGMYGGGFGRRRDDARAADLYQRAAEQGLAEGQFRLGIIYESGRGRPQDLAEARRWYFQAAQQGYTKARAALQRRQADGDVQAQALLRRLP